MKNIGTIVRGIRGPIIKQGDPLADIVVDSVLAAQQEEGFSFHDRDIVAVTEAVVARAQGNYATVEQIAADVRKKTKGGTVGLLFPILSRNRFSLLLKGIARGVDELIIQLSYPSDEVGNPLISIDKVDEAGIDTYSDSFTEEEFRRIFPEVKHPFTGIDYISLYKEYAGPHCKIVISNRPEYLLNYTDKIINADIHTRKRTKRILQAKGAKEVWSLHDFLTESVDGSGYNPTPGLLGSILAT